MSQTEQSAPGLLTGVEHAHSEAAGLLEEYSTLLRRLGAGQLSPALPFTGEIPGRDDLAGVAGIARFLENYYGQMLAPVELPAITRACGFALAGQTREMVKLDLQLGERPLFAPFAAASRKIGRWQLERLRPLRDERTVQRYLAAVETGDAHGWHTVVYGLTLAVYSWPLRQGLMLYARQTLTGLAHAAAKAHSVSEVACGDGLQSLFERLPKAIDQTIGDFEIS